MNTTDLCGHTFYYSSPRSTSGIPESIWLESISSVFFCSFTWNLSGTLYRDLILASYLKIEKRLWVFEECAKRWLHNYNEMSSLSSFTPFFFFDISCSMYCNLSIAETKHSCHRHATSCYHHRSPKTCSHVCLIVTLVCLCRKGVGKSLQHFILCAVIGRDFTCTSKSSLITYSSIWDGVTSFMSTSPPVFSLNGSGWTVIIARKVGREITY